MDELSKKWKDLSDIQQATIIELVAGKHQGNVFSSLMANFQTARDALDTSLNSSGSAMAEHAKWSESLEARLNKLKAAWQGLSQTFMNSDFLKVSMDLITGLVNTLDKLIDSLGSFGTIGVGVGIWGLLSKLSTVTKDSGGLRSLSNIANILSAFGGAFPKAAEGIKTFTDSIKTAKVVGAMTNALSGGTSAVTLLGQAAIVSKGAIKGLWTVIAAHPVIAAVAAIGAAIVVIEKFHESAKELRERIEELTDSYRTQHEELIKLKGDYDTSNEDSMISKYGKLSKGVNALGENVSLTADEYAEYQSVVNTIAEQIPSVVTGFNSQGDAILSCAGDVDKLTEAYHNLIKEQNKEVLNNGEDIIKNFGNNVEKSSAYSVDENGNVVSYLEELKSLINMSDEELEASLRGNARLSELSSLLDEYGIKRDVLGSGKKGYEGYYDHVVRAVKENRKQFKEILDKATSDSDVYTKEMDSLVESYFSTAFLGGDSGAGIGDYSNLSERMQKIINQAISNFDTEFYNNLFNGIESPEEKYTALVNHFNSILDSFKNMNDADSAKIEAAFDLSTKFNGGEISYGEYVDGLYDVGQTIDKLVKDGKLDKEIGSQIKLNIGLDENGMVKDYQTLVNRLVNSKEIGMKHTDATEFINSLNASELSVAIDLIANEKVDLSNFDAESLKKYIEEQANIQEALSFNADIEIDTTALEVLNKALAESVSALGLTSESIDSLKSRYSSLDSFDPSTLFEATANGVKVNRDELVKLEREYNNLTKSEVKKHLDTLVGEYNDVTAEIDKCTNASERATLIAKRETYADKIEELATYQAQLEGVTGAYQRWIDAQNTLEDYEGYQAIATSREDIEDEIGRGFISNATKEYIDLLSGEDLVGGTIDDYASAWEKLDKKVGSTSYSIHDFFTVNDDGDITSTGIDRFFKGLQQDFKGEVAKFNKESGKWEYDFSQENLKKIQDEWGIGIEAIELLLEAATSAGYDVDWGGILDNLDLDTSGFETLVSVAEAAQKELNKLEGYEDLKFNFVTTNVADATTEIEKAQKAYSELINKDGKVNLEAEGAEQMRVVLSTLLVQKQQLEDSEIAINISTSGLDDAQAKAVAWVQDFRTKYKNLEIAISTGEGIDEAKTELETVKTSLGELDDTTAEIAAKLVFGEDTGTTGAGLKSQVNTAINSIGEQDINVGFKLSETALSGLNSQLLTNFTVDATAKITNVDKSQLETVETNGLVNWDENTDNVSKSFEASGTVNWDDNVENVKTSFSANGTVKWTSGNKVKVNVISEANGTANANGTAQNGRAFRHGDWGIKGSGTALVGELGMETLVRGGRFYTIGDNGAEFIKYRQGDIIFNHKQTEELFKNGKVTSNGGRGKMFADGSAFADGAAFWRASASTSNFANNRLEKVAIDGSSSKSKDTSTKSETKVKGNSVTTNVTTTFNANSTESDFSKEHAEKNESDKNTDKFNETFDWIEIAISRVQRAIDKLDKTASNVYKSWSDRNKALTSEIGKVKEEIELQQSAYNEYIKEANSVGLDESYAKKVRNGTIDIQDFSGKKDEALVEKIKEYQQWYEKALACKDAIEDLREEESKIYEQRFENVQTQYEGILQGYEHTEAMLNEYISQAEAKGHIVSKKYYQALIDNEKSNIEKLKQEQSALIAQRDNAVASGAIVKGSQAWYDMCAEIDSVTQAIEEGNTALIEYGNSIRDIDWQTFDLIQERISDVTAEADFLIELMSNKDLFDDDGKLTDQGLATMALHGQNYNAYMYQADDYGAEVANLDAQIAKDPYDQELINRRNELLELQREYILAAEDEKNAIRDLVEEGINLELDALQERIDKKNEELESEKDLYEYQKKVKEQTKEIASLQKQLSSYEGFDDEETKAKVQQLKVELEEAETNLKETEWDRYIDQQAQILDTLYNEYELVLNTRLDNIDLLLGNIVSEVNASASTIKETLEGEVSDVGTKLSEAMSNIWVGEGAGKAVIDLYGGDFQSKLTTTNLALGSIKANVDAMVDDVDKEAEQKVNAPQTQPSSADVPTGGNTGGNTDIVPDGGNGGDGIPKVGDAVTFKSGKYYYSSDGLNPSGSSMLGKTVYITKISNASWSKKPYHIARDKEGKKPLGWLSLDQLSGYATGKKNFLDDELAWTQERGKEEYIVRPSDGAILTPIARRGSVLNAKASENLWNMTNSPAEFIKDNLGIGSTNVPNNSTVSNNITQNFENITFSMPNVHGYNDLLTEMQRDPKFEKLVLSMTIDRIAGRSSLAKGKTIK